MSLQRPDRNLSLVTMGLLMAASLIVAPRAVATPESPATSLPLAEPMASLASDLQLDEADAPLAPLLPATRWERQGKATRVFLDGRLLFTFAGDEGAIASAVVQRLESLKRQGALRSDRITPARQGGRYAVRVGSSTVLEVDDAFASKQGARAGALTLTYVNTLRNHLGGVPIQVQASRGLLPGARNAEGKASWYGGLFHGRRAASGERFDMHAHTAAHKTLPFGTLLLVTNLSNGKTTLVRVTDRGPYAHGRTLDVSRAAAEALGMVRSGVARVRYTILH